jgi:hypothetical protein
MPAFGREHLCRTCRNCGYSFAEATKDGGQEGAPAVLKVAH